MGLEQRQEIERLTAVLQTEDTQYQDDFLSAQQRFLDTEVCIYPYIHVYTVFFKYDYIVLEV